MPKVTLATIAKDIEWIKKSLEEGKKSFARKWVEYFVIGIVTITCGSVLKSMIGTVIPVAQAYLASNI